MNKNTLLLGQALLLGLILVLGGIVVTREKIPVLNSKNVKENITSYYNENFKDLDVESKKLEYDKSSNSYSITYYDKLYNDLYFTITSKNNKISDDYEESYVEGKYIMSKNSEKVLDKYNDLFKDSIYEKIKISFSKLNSYDDVSRTDILEGNIYDKGYYSVSYYVKVDSLDYNYLTNIINSFIDISKNNGLVANSYSITFDNSGIIKLVNVLEEGEIIYE